MCRGVRTPRPQAGSAPLIVGGTSPSREKTILFLRIAMPDTLAALLPGTT